VVNHLISMIKVYLVPRDNSLIVILRVAKRRQRIPRDCRIILAKCRKYVRYGLKEVYVPGYVLIRLTILAPATLQYVIAFTRVDNYMLPSSSRRNRTVYLSVRCYTSNSTAAIVPLAYVPCHVWDHHATLGKH
jgi:hypothetical protein